MRKLNLAVFHLKLDLANRSSPSTDHNLRLHPSVLEKNPAPLEAWPAQTRLSAYMLSYRPSPDCKQTIELLRESHASLEIRCPSSDITTKSPAHLSVPPPSTFRPRAFSAPRRVTPLHLKFDRSRPPGTPPPTAPLSEQAHSLESPSMKDSLPVLFHTGATRGSKSQSHPKSLCPYLAASSPASTCFCGEAHRSVLRVIRADKTLTNNQRRYLPHNV